MAGRQPMSYSDIKYMTINPPAGMTCSQYMDPFIFHAGGYLTNLGSTTDELLNVLFNLKYSNRQRNVGIG